MWHFVALTRDTVNDKVSLNIDGIENKTISTTSDAIYRLAANVLIGTYNAGGYFFPGRIESVKLFHNALSPQEIKDYFNCEKGHFQDLVNFGSSSSSSSSGAGLTCVNRNYTGPSGVILDLRPGDITGTGLSADNSTITTSWPDLSGSNNHSALVNFTLPSNGGQSGWVENPSSLRFDGTDDYAYIADSSLFDLTDFTLSAFIKVEGSASSYRRILSQQNGNNYWLLNLEDNKLQGWLNLDGITRENGTFGPALNDNKWHHVAITRDTDNDNISWWLDGTQIGSQTTTSDAAYNIASNVYLGAYPGAGQDFQGKIGNVKVINKALSAQEINAYYNCEKPSTLCSNNTLTFNPVSVQNIGASVISKDFNKDGKSDLATANINSCVLFGNGNATFQNTCYGTNNATTITSADFNGDGILDLVLGTSVVNNHPQIGYSSSYYYYLQGNGAGGFSGPYGITVNSYNTNNPGIPLYPVDTQPLQLASADFNKDGYFDLAISDQWTRRVLLYLGNGNGIPIVVLSNAGGGSIISNDFNKDGNFDLAFTNPFNNNISVLLGNGNSTFRQALNYTTGGTNPKLITSGDFDNNGILDLAVTNTGSNSFSVFPGNADGSFQTPAKIYSTVTKPTSISSGDLNRDNKADIIIGTSNGNTYIFIAGISGNFTQAATSYTKAGPYAINDFNGDGSTDFSYSGGILLNNTCFP